jgi:hypothetical protein
MTRRQSELGPAVFSGVGVAAVAGGDGDTSLRLAGVEGVNQPTMRGSGERSSPEEGIGSGGGSKSGCLGGGFRRWGGRHTITGSQEGGVVHFRVVRHRQRREFEGAAISCRSRGNGEMGVSGPGAHSRRRRRGPGRHVT